MLYAITNGKNYIGQNIYEPVPVQKAKTFTDIDKAKNFLKNLPKSFRNLGHQIVIVDDKYNKEIPKIIEENFVSESFDCFFMDSIKDYVSKIQYFYKQLPEQKKYYEEQLKIAEKELMDIVHATEFFKLNAAQGYKIYKMAHDARVRRRKAKDALEIIGYIEEGGLNSIMDGTTLRRIEGKENREYRPRILQELFESGA